jgi:hypothetical protein
MRDGRRWFWWKGEHQYNFLYESYVPWVSITFCAIMSVWDFDCLLAVRRPQA